MNKEYQDICGVSKRTAAYDLAELVEKFKILKRQGENVGTFYEIE